MTKDQHDAYVRHRPQPSAAARTRRPRLVAHAFLLALAIVAAVYAGLAQNDPLTGRDHDLITGALLSQNQDLPRSLTGEPLPGQALQPASLNDPVEAARRLGLPGLSGPTQNGLCEPGETAAYCIYLVREGDTLSGIAELFGLNGGVVPGWELLAGSNKPDIVNVDDFIQPGQKLRVPLARGVVHTILLNETVGDLAGQFDVTSPQIIAANSLANPDLLTSGQVIFIPDPNKLPSAELPASAGGTPSEPEPAARPFAFVWPITASLRITNYMSARHPLGIDMGLGHAPGSAIVAVEDGTVEFAGGNACCSYGLYVIVDHGNGLKTLYAHLSRIDVAKGQRVSQGESLGPSGRTGYSTGVHLHFEVHQDGKRRNPIDYLP